MRVLFLQDHLRMGGTEKNTLALARYGGERGQDTGLLVFRPGGVLKPDAPTPFYFRELQPFNSHIDEWAPGLGKAVRSFAPDAIIFMGKVAHLYLPLLRKEFPSVRHIATFRSSRSLFTYNFKAFKQADAIFCNSHYARKWLVRVQKHSLEKIEVIHNGCLLTPPQTPTGRHKGSHLRFLCVAMFRPSKNQRELLFILSSLPQRIPWKCTFLGAGKTLKACRRLAREMDLDDRVLFRKNVPPESLYPEHDLALLTSSGKESLPNFLVEAQCFGLPAIAYLVNGVGECFAEGKSGFGIPLGDRSAFQSALIRLADNPDLQTKMGENARLFGKSHFDFSEKSAEFFSKLEEVEGSGSC